ncbi:MAG: glycosyltransferase family 4 protein [Candidatus Hydrogenedentota bacterium]
MTHVLIVAHNFPPMAGGIARLVYDLTSSLPPEDVYVLAPHGVSASLHKGYNPESEHEATAFDAEQPFQTERMDYDQRTRLRTVVSVLRAAIRVVRLVRAKRPMVIYYSVTYPLGLTGLLAKWIFHTPYVVQAHGTELIRSQGRLRAFFTYVLLRNAYQVIANSQWTKNTVLQKGIPADHVTVINPKIDPDRFRDPCDMDSFAQREGLQGRRVLLTVARLEARKGHRLVIQALPEVIRRHPDVLYVIMGTGPGRAALEREAQALNVDRHVRFEEYREVNNFYRLCEMFIMPSTYIECPYPDVEGFGIAFLEANACKRPVIGSDSGGIPDAIEDGVSGLIARAGDVEHLTEKILTLLDNPEYASRLGEQGYDRVHSEFRIERFREEFEDAVLIPLNRNG